MLTPEGLFFAPNLRFKDLNEADANKLADALEARARHWFLIPAKNIAKSAPFASGIIVTCFIDAAAEIEGVNKIDWLQEAVPNSSNNDPRRTNKSIAGSFIEDVRHGLVHHSRLNRGAEFSLDFDEPLGVVDQVLIVNPLLLADAVMARWNHTIDTIRSSDRMYHQILNKIHRVFRVDFEADMNWNKEIYAG